MYQRRHLIDGKMKPADLVRAILDNTHESLKWLWQIVMSLALINAVSKYVDILDGAKLDDPQDVLSMLATDNTVVFVSFILVFIRFFFGDSRHLDLSYLETHYRYGLERELGKYTGAKRFFDILSLILHGVIFYLMSHYIGNLDRFLHFFGILLMCNSIWLLVQFASLWSSNKARRDQFDSDELFGGTRRYSALLVWSINNLIHSGAILLFLFAPGISNNLIWGLVFTLLNSLVDFVYTWKFYFPDLSSIMRNPGETHFDVFVSLPMASQPNDAKYREDRDFGAKLVGQLKVGLYGFESIYYAAEHIESAGGFDPEFLSAKNDFEAIRNSDYFFLIYLAPVASSALFEAGFALAMEKKCIYFVKSRNDLPFLLKNAAEVFSSCIRIVEVEDADEACKILKDSDFRQWHYSS